MKTLLRILLVGIIIVTMSSIGFSQGVNIDDTGVAINEDESTSHASAILDIKSNSQGILIPRMDSATIVGITSPAKGLLAYDTINTVFWFNDGSSWKKLNQWSESGNNYTLPDSDGLANQVLSTNGSGTLSWATSSDGDITGVTAGDGLTGGGTSGNATLNVVASNGLTDVADGIKLGGTLSENTTITHGANTFKYRLNEAGNFWVEGDNRPSLFVRNDNLVGINTDAPSVNFDVNGKVRIREWNILKGEVSMVVANGDGYLATQEIPSGDITGVIAGNGLTGGGSSGDVTLHVYAANGLTTEGNAIKFGGSLLANTTVTQGNYGMTYNLTGSGDFDIQDNGTSKFFVQDNGKVGVNTSTPNSTFGLDGSFSAPVRTVNTNYTATASDFTIFIGSSFSSVTISLPTASGIAGRIYNIKGTTCAQTMTIDPYSTQQIEGSSTRNLRAGENITIQSDGSNWWIID